MRTYIRFAFLALMLSFASAPLAYASTPLVASARFTSPSTVTISYSTPVYSTLNDYGTFTGALSGASLASISGSGTSIIVLTFSGATFSPSATGGLNIASTVVSVNDGAQIGSGPYVITDGQAPQVSSFSLSSNLAYGTVARTGDTLTASFTANESITNPSITIAGHSLGASGYGNGPYTANYTLTSSDTQDTVPVSASFTDIVGNQGTGSFTLGGGLGPRIVSITSDATATGVLSTGNTINFILTLASPTPGAYVSGSYDGVALTWSTNNGGATYTATYTVQNTNASTYSPLQISGVTVRDSSGYVSQAASGSDVRKTINAQSFSISFQTTLATNFTTQTPLISFYSAQDGVISWGGDCSSLNLTAISGTNYVTLKPLTTGTHSNCTITVTNQAGYASNILTIPAFSISGADTPVTSTTINTTPVASTHTYRFTLPLKIGSLGAEVTALQNRLTSEGVYSGPITGKFGAQTEAAVKKYQKLHGLSQLGSVGPGTRTALNAGQ